MVKLLASFGTVGGGRLMSVMEVERVLSRLTGLGNGRTDIVLKDQLVVYDNDNQRLGWKPYDCKCSFLAVDDWQLLALSAETEIL